MASYVGQWPFFYFYKSKKMIQTNELRIGNYLSDKEGRLCKVEFISPEEFRAYAIAGGRTTLPNEKIKFNKEWAKKLGFTITDMGDFWEFEKNGFTMIQLKIPITGKELPPFYMLHSKKPQYIKIHHVHKLQNLYFEITEQELTLN